MSNLQAPADLKRRANLTTPLVALVVLSAVTVFLLGTYSTLKTSQARLLETSVHNQAQLLEAVARFDAINSRTDHSQGSLGATLSQAFDAARASSRSARPIHYSFYRIGDFGLEELLPTTGPQPHYRAQRQPEPFADLAQKAATGHRGHAERQWRGQSYLVAYAPVSLLHLGVVAWVPLDSLHDQFWRDALAYLPWALLLAGLGAWGLNWLVKPLLLSFEGQLETLEGLKNRLEEAEQRLDQAQALSKVGSFEWDLNQERMEWTGQLYRLLGAEPEETRPTWERLLAEMHPEDRPRARELLRLAKEGQKRFRGEWRFLIQGRTRVFALRGDLRFDPLGQPTKLTASLQDVTVERENLRRIGLMARVFESAQEAVVITDENNRIVEVNPAHERITGYSKQEVLGQDPKMFASKRHDQTFYREMWQQLNQTGAWEGEIWDRRKSGEVYPKYLSIQSFLDGDSQQTYYLGIFSDVSRQKRQEEKLHQIAYFDPLTEQPNRANLLEALRRAQPYAARHDKQQALFCLDLSNFKQINDSLGHVAGDQLLYQVARRLSEHRRRSDMVARLGGDEFALFLKDVSGPEGAAKVAEEVLIELAEPFLINEQEVYTGASLGIALFPKDADQPEALLKCADTAMYAAKSLGKGQYTFFSEAMNRRARQRQFLTTNLHRALENDEFKLMYQPLVSAADGKLLGMEALVRWMHPERGLVPPDEFIPLAEETGLILPIGEKLLHQATRQVRRWQAEGLNPPPVAVNLSARQFQDPNLQHQIAEALASTGLEPRFLELEITEGVALTDLQATVDQLQSFREMGVTASLDDFGTGYSSLSYLKRLPVAKLKLDRSFVADLPTESRIARSVITLGQSLDLVIVAEGVENLAQTQFLQEMRTDLLQGFLFSKPLWPKELEAILRAGEILPPGFLPNRPH